MEFRKEYEKGELKDDSVEMDPIMQFRLWFDLALKFKIPKLNAATLATVSEYGRPSARIILLKEFDKSGFVFFTNYNGRKGKELENNPYAALVIHWKELDRQVRIEGETEKITTAESDEYFNSRTVESKISAIISRQSQIVENRKQLDERWIKFSKENNPDNIRRPENWGGFRVKPVRIEFWQGSPNRLNDRILYSKDKNKWRIERLEP